MAAAGLLDDKVTPLITAFDNAVKDFSALEKAQAVVAVINAQLASTATDNNRKLKPYLDSVPSVTNEDEDATDTVSFVHKTDGALGPFATAVSDTESQVDDITAALEQLVDKYPCPTPEVTQTNTTNTTGCCSRLAAAFSGAFGCCAEEAADAGPGKPTWSGSAGVTDTGADKEGGTGGAARRGSTDSTGSGVGADSAPLPALTSPEARGDDHPAGSGNEGKRTPPARLSDVDLADDAAGDAHPTDL